MKKTIAISGSTGFVGSHLSETLKKEGNDIIAITRKDFKMPANELAQKLNGVDALIHLAGAPIIKRWTEEYKKEIYHSRIDTTDKLVAAMKEMNSKPQVFISTSAIGIYEDDQEHTEQSENLNDGFMGRVCVDWEASARAAKPLTRVVIFRLGVVLGEGGGAMQPMLPLFKAGLGGKIGSGKQGFSWVHLDDVIAAYLFALRNNKLEGPFNLTAPEAVDNATFTKTLAKALRRPAIFPVPPFGLRILYGEGAQALTSGSFVRPERLITNGFSFRYPELKGALEDIV